MLSNTTDPVHIVVADDHVLFREGIVSLISNEPGFQVAGQASNGKELLQLVEQLRPHVVITDIQMPIMNGIEATKAISKNFPHTAVIALSMYSRNNMVVEMLAAGAKGYLLKSSDSHELITAIKTVTESGSYYSGSTISSLVQSVNPNGGTPMPTTTPLLTDKEKTVIRLMCQQYSNKEIASRLQSSVRSIESARERIQTKTGAKNMIGVVLYAIQSGIIFFNDFTEQGWRG
jgi:DNA-binding NarL/FixJ family response regulator